MLTRRRSAVIVSAALVAGLASNGLVSTTSTASAAGPAAEILVLSNRADLISGGDALVEIVPPEGTDLATLRVDVDGRDVTEAFGRRADGRVYGLIDRLRAGDNQVTARVRGARVATLEITNHPIGGPVFSGPQVQPWLCETEEAGLGPAVDEQCNARTRVEWLYKSGTTGQFGTYNPDDPPADVASTTTDQGHKVPYILRKETGTINRGVYSFWVLYDPAKPWEPWAPQNGWNHKLYYLFEGGATPNHRQGSAPPDALLAASENSRPPLDDTTELALSRGFAVASATLNVFGQNINSVTSAETVMMVKERMVERLGEIRYTMARGCSGGSVQQQLIAETYPGLLDGVQPSCSFPDALTPAGPFAADCGLLLRYFNRAAPHLWPAERQRAAVTGHPSITSCESVVTATGLDRTLWDPRIGCMGGTINPGGLTPEPDYVYDPRSNPGGARCTLQDYQQALYGPRPASTWTAPESQLGRGFANRPYDNTGVQYGLRALESGLITPAQFVDLNAKIGGRDIDYDWQAGRSQADPLALERAYRSGQLNSGRQLERVPIIDLRGSSNLEFHPDFHSYSMRERLRRANGHADNQIIWTTTQAPEPAVNEASFRLLDEWLSRIEADGSSRPLPEKVVSNKPAQAVDACWIAGNKVTDRATCRAAFPYFGDPRIAAGGPLSNDVIKCQVKPLDRADYDATFSSLEWRRLQQTFVTGVCDYSRPSAGKQPSIPWLTYPGGPDGQPLTTR